MLPLVIKAWNHRLIRYLIVGSWNTLFSLITLSVAQTMFRFDFGTGVIFTFAMLISIIQSYFTHRKLIWRTSNVVHREFPKFLIVAVVNYMINLALIVLLVDHLKWHLILSQIVIVGLLTLINYSVLRAWTFNMNHAKG